MVARGDGAPDALGAADGPVLLEGLGAFNGWGVGSSAHVDVVGAAVGGDLALLGCAAGGVVCAEGFDDVVLDEGVLAPAVEGEVAVAVGAVCAGIIDRSDMCISRFPSI